FASFDDLVRFVLSTDWFGWRNTQAVSKTAPTWTPTFPITGPKKTSSAQVGVQCTNMPVGSVFDYTGLGPHGLSDGVASGSITIQNPNQTLFLPMTFPANFNTSMAVNWYANGHPPDTGALITPYLAVVGSQAMAALGGRLPNRAGIMAQNAKYGDWDTVYPFGSITGAFV